MKLGESTLEPTSLPTAATPRLPGSGGRGDNRRLGHPDHLPAEAAGGLVP